MGYFSVRTIELNRVVTEEYDEKKDKFVNRVTVTKEPRLTRCNSKEDAMDFLEEIATRQHPNILRAMYAGHYQ